MPKVIQQEPLCLCFLNLTRFVGKLLPVNSISALCSILYQMFGSECLFVFIKFTKLANTMFCLKSSMCYGVILVMLINLGGVGLLKLQFSSIK